MDGRIGGTPVFGCHGALVRPSQPMTAPARDRVTIDLRGIGDAVRASAVSRGVTVAHFSRQALIEAIGMSAAGPAAPSAGYWASRKSKLTLRLYPHDFEVLVVNAAQLGLSYGDYVGRLAHGTPLPLARRYRALLDTMGADIARHLERASSSIASQ